MLYHVDIDDMHTPNMLQHDCNVVSLYTEGTYINPLV